MGSALLRSLASSILVISVGCTTKFPVGGSPLPDLAMSTDGGDGGAPSSGKMPDAGLPRDGDVGFVSPPPDELVLEVAGKTFRLCTSMGWEEMAADTGKFCHGGASGAAYGPVFDTASCGDSSDPPPSPRYELAVMFRNFDKTGLPAETSFDLANPLHQRFVSVVLWVDSTIYCTDIPGAGTDMSTDMGSDDLAIAGMVVAHKFVPRLFPGTSHIFGYVTDVEITNVHFAPNAGQDVYTVVHGHLYQP